MKKIIPLALMLFSVVPAFTQYICWIEEDDIKRWDEATEQVETIFTLESIESDDRLDNLMFDNTNDILYFVIERYPGSDSIAKVNIDGTGFESIHSVLSNHTEFDIDVINQYIYYDQGSFHYRLNLSNGESEELPFLQWQSEILINGDNNYIYYIEYDVDNDNLIRIDPDNPIDYTSYPIDISESFSLLNIDYCNEKIYAFAGSDIVRFNLDGTDVETVISFGINNPVLFHEVSIDPTQGYIYTYEFQYTSIAYQIARYDLAGNNKELIINDITETNSCCFTINNFSDIPCVLETIEIEHFHYLPDHPSFSDEPLSSLGSRLIDGATNYAPFKICTDGSSASIFQVSYLFNNSIDIDEYSLRIAEDINQDYPEIFGSFSPITPINNNSIAILYTHPEYLASDENGSIINLEIVENEIEEVVETLQIELYNPPVMMVHGLGSGKSAFSTFEKFLINNLNYPFQIIQNVDYRGTNDRSFQENGSVLPQNIVSCLKDARKSGFSASKVNIVAHSMGGILSRLYLQSDLYYNEINKLITINTPHSGSQLANILLDEEIDTDVLCKALMDWNILFECNGGAINDLQVDSDAILSDLNGVNLNKNVIPSHAIVTIVNPLDVQVILLKKILGLFLLADLFNGEQSDMIVSQSSQVAGLIVPNVTYKEDISHISSTDDLNIIQDIGDILSAEPKGLLFAQNGFSPPQLEYNVNEYINFEISESLIDLHSSFENQTVNYGDEIDIQLSSDMVMESTILIYEGVGLLTSNNNETFNSSNFSINRSITPNSLGAIPITAFSFNDSYIARDTMLINVDVQSQPIKFIETNGTFFVGQQANLSVTAYFDGFSVDISRAPEISYSFKNGLVEYLGDGYILPLYEGIDTFTVTFNGVTSQEFSLYISDNEVSSNTYDQEYSSLIEGNKVMISPNPGRDYIEIKAYELGKPVFAFMRIINANGQTVKGNKEYELHDDDPIRISISDFPNGMYYLLLDSKIGAPKAFKFIKQ
jgi:pimeloyl-ACP methyl ester carboxylesterase